MPRKRGRRRNTDAEILAALIVCEMFDLPPFGGPPTGTPAAEPRRDPGAPAKPTPARRRDPRRTPHDPTA